MNADNFIAASSSFFLLHVKLLCIIVVSEIHVQSTNSSSICNTKSVVNVWMSETYVYSNNTILIIAKRLNANKKM